MVNSVLLRSCEVGASLLDTTSLVLVRMQRRSFQKMVASLHDCRSTYTAVTSHTLGAADKADGTAKTSSDPSSQPLSSRAYPQSV